ncbi:MAG: Sortase [Microbacteriaceae bacterium]|nr:Sortase [Microbacteriaceae bacterium]
MATSSSRRAAAVLGTATVLSLAFLPLSAAQAAPLDGPIHLGTAGDFGVLAASTVTNTGPTLISRNLGLSPGTSITGFPPGRVAGEVQNTTAVATQAQVDVSTAYKEAASLTPSSTTRYEDLAGLSLTPGVYSGGELSLTGDLTLAGGAESVWVFQADSTLITGSSSNIIVTGGASVCNVFWQVGSSATLGTESTFVGTILANNSITATTGADVTGRLLASNGAVTLDSNVITTVEACDTEGEDEGEGGDEGDGGEGSESDTPVTVTSGAPTPITVGTPYGFQIDAAGTPTPTFTVGSGALPEGLTLDTKTGLVSGTPVARGPGFTVVVSNGVSPDATVAFEFAPAPVPVVTPPVVNPPVVTPPVVTPPVAPEATPATPVVSAPVQSAPGRVQADTRTEAERLADTGAETSPLLMVGALLLLVGGALYLVARLTRTARARRSQ